MNNNDDLFGSLSQIIGIQSKLNEKMSPLTEIQEKIASALAIANRTVTPIDFKLLLPIEEKIDYLQTLTNVAKNMPVFQLTTNLFSSFETSNHFDTTKFSQSIKIILDNMSSDITLLNTPVLDWLRGFDLSPIINVLQLNIDPNIAINFRNRLNEKYLRAMYESKWIPYSGIDKDGILFQEVFYIISQSKGASKRREKRIDKAILSHYTDNRIRGIRREWNKTNLERYIKRALVQSIDAYLRREYALTVACLSTMWEGMIYIKAKNADATSRCRQKMRVTKEEFKQLIEYNDFNTILADYFNNFIVSNCNGVGDVIDGVPNRHGYAHGWYPKYPSQKAALNSILLTDFIIHLSPMQSMEES